MKTQYDDWPREEKADNGYWYAFYRDAHGQPHRVSLRHGATTSGPFPYNSGPRLFFLQSFVPQ